MGKHGLYQSHTNWEVSDTGKGLVMNHDEELTEQITLMRKQFVFVHEQLARIESKIDNLNYLQKKREAVQSNLGSCY